MASASTSTRIKVCTRDARVGSIAPTAAQLSRVSTLGATARWNRYGTVQFQAFS